MHPGDPEEDSRERGAQIEEVFSGSEGEKTAATNAAMTVREEGACPLNYSLPLLDNLLRVIY